MQQDTPSRNHADLINAYLDLTAEDAVPTLHKKWAVISAIAASLERKVWIMRNDAVIYPNLYIFIIGLAGVGKSTAVTNAYKFVWRMGVQQLPAVINEQSFYKELNRIGEEKTFEWAENRYKMSAGTLFASEAKTTFKEMYSNGGIIDVLTDLYNGGDAGFSHDASRTKSTMGGGSMGVYNPCINLIACSTPAWLGDVMSKKIAEGGFGSRVLLVNWPYEFVRSHEWIDTTQEKLIFRKTVREDFEQVYALKGPLKPTSEFKQLRLTVFTAFDEKRRKTVLHNLTAGYFERKYLQADKLAIICSVSEGNGLTLEARHFERAWALLEEIESHMVEAYGDIGLPVETRNANMIWNYLLTLGSDRFNHIELKRTFKKQFDTVQLRNALNALSEENRITYLELESDLKHNRRIYRINREFEPSLLVKNPQP